MYKLWKDLWIKEDPTSQKKAKEIETQLVDIYSEGIYNDIKTEIGNIIYEEGGLNSGNWWKLRNKLKKKCPDPPTAMKDEYGNLITGKE